MKRLFLKIPHIYPHLEIICENERIMDYLYNMFLPFISWEVADSKEYIKLAFYKDDDGRLIVEDSCQKRMLNINIVSYLETYMLMNSYTDKGYLMLHGGCVAYGEKAFAFLANSMVGKSTLVTHLCLDGFEYMTDDRLIFDTNEMTILPFTKTIMLRESAREVLHEKYGHALDTIPFSYKWMCRDFFYPQCCRKEKTKVACLFILERVECKEMRRETIVGTQKVIELLKYNMSIKSSQNLEDFIKCSNIRMERIYYYDLKQVSAFLKSI